MKKTIASLIIGFAVSSASASVIDASQDNYVRRNAPDGVMPLDANLLVKAALSNDPLTRKAWLSFDIGALNLSDPLTSINAASFLLTIAHNGGFYSNSTQVFNVFGLTDESLDSWSEQTLTWNNAPGNSSSDTGANSANTTLLGQFSLFDNASAVGTEVSISGQPLIDFLLSDTNGNATLIVTRSTRQSYVTFFHSSETGVANVSTPRLSVDVFQEISEPSTLGLLLLPGLAIALRARRKGARLN